MDKSHLDHAAEVLRRLLETREDAAGFLEPTDQTLDNVAPSVGVAVKLDEAGVAIFVLLGRNDRNDVQFDQVLVNPVSPVSLVTGQGHRPSDGLVVPVKQIGIRLFEQGREGCRLMRLSCREVKVQRMAFPVTQDMDFRRKTSARAA